MEEQTVNLTSLICDSINEIFFKIFSSIQQNVYSNLDGILMIDSSILDTSSFKQIFGTDSTNGILLLANSLICGIVLFYIIQYTFIIFLILCIIKP